MSGIIREMGALLRDPKFWDLEVKCEGRSYYVHRVIVCSNSPVLARECESREPGTIVIEQNVFDGLTLERMLLFMYEGDYTVKVLGDDATKKPAEAESTLADEDLPHSAQPAEEHRSGADESCVASQTQSPHAEEGSYLESQVLVRSEERRPAILDSAVAHLRVYAIAMMYKIQDPQNLALQKFEARLEVVTAEGFAEVARAVYTNTAIEGDVLSAEVSAVALKRLNELMDSSVFMNMLLEDPDLQILAGVLVPAVFKHAKSKQTSIEKLELKVSELQDKLAGLKQDLLGAENRAQDYHTERELAVATAKPSATEAELKRQLDCAMKENEVMASTFADLKRRLQKATTALSSLSQTEKSLYETKESLSHANKSLSHTKDSLSRTRQSLAVSEAVAKGNAAERDTWRKKHDKRDRALYDVMGMVNTWKACRNSNCDEEFHAFLQWDDRSASDDRGLMLRCGSCRCKHYGKLAS
ncbi:hypothetical protein LTR12_008525 [Friedmanniomyces endolithicus]|nr:hypothetical protein LTR74_015501 [Friedmanniomyces endolithicus]KAK1817036.1 hypothetical protein LTR12_008525 [Friedmanniomyces endolithicus]